MDKEKFEELLAKGRENLTVEERNNVAQFILNDEKSREICINGALASGNMNLALGLIYRKAKLEL